MGGPSGGCLPESLLDLPVDYETINQTGAIVGSGGMIVIDEDNCIVDTARYFLSFTQQESCGKCPPCRIGTKRMLEILNKICEGKGTLADIDVPRGDRLSRSRSARCAPWAAPPPTRCSPPSSTSAEEFSEHVLEKKCRAGACAGAHHLSRSTPRRAPDAGPAPGPVRSQAITGERKEVACHRSRAVHQVRCLLREVSVRRCEEVLMSPAGSNGQETITLTLNGREVQAQPGQTILEVARADGVDIPTLCYDTRLEAYGACRMCLVEVEGARGPMAACGTKVSDGMKVQTHTEKIAKLRKFVLELLLTNHPLDCPVCEAAGDCRLQDYAYEYLVDMVPWGWRPPSQQGPGRPSRTWPITAPAASCAAAACASAGKSCPSAAGATSTAATTARWTRPTACRCRKWAACPAGSASAPARWAPSSGSGPRRAPARGRPTKTATTCSYCADGCRLVVHSFRDRVVRVASEEREGPERRQPVRQGPVRPRLRRRGRPADRAAGSEAGGELQDASWDEALKAAAGKIDAVRREPRGPGRGGRAAAPTCTNEAAYLAQKLMRTVVGSNNIDSIDHPDLAAAEKALERGSGHRRRHQLALRPRQRPTPSWCWAPT